ncbi:MAG TPA: hypothetical protein VEK07_09700 [Polyangiaceae bacterium]|nr:hypothetical protein [Polyangiaceae bacterium]
MIDRAFLDYAQWRGFFVDPCTRTPSARQAVINAAYFRKPAFPERRARRHPALRPHALLRVCGRHGAMKFCLPVGA